MAEPAEPVVMCPPISGALGLAGKAVTAAPAGYSTVTAGPAETAVPPGGSGGASLLGPPGLAGTNGADG